MGDGIQAVFEGPMGSLRLGVERYQFPEITHDAWDSNWLIITGDATLNGKPWRFRDPCLTTFEMQRLADWLDQVVAGKADQKPCWFTEPNLDFRQMPDQAIRIGFSLEALPPWRASGGDDDEIGFSAPIDSHLVTAANSLRRLLIQFPVRGSNL